MALATRCPACETVFRISTSQAAAKSGMVRCGECLHAFNSLDALVRVEDLDIVETPPDADASGDSLASPPPPEFSPSDDEDDDDRLDLPSEFDLEVDPATVGPLGPDDTDTVLSNLTHDTDPGARRGEGDAPIREWWQPAEGELIVPPPMPVADEPIRSLADERVDLEWPRDPDRDRPEFMREAKPERARRSRTERIALAVLSLLALLVLAGQAAYAWRDELAARVPAARPALLAGCALLRCRVDLPAHLDALTIESTAVQMDAPNGNTYTLTALLRNRDAVALRYPSLALTLTDTRDQPILRRVLRPEDYVPADRLAGGFAADSELPVRVTFELTDLRFVGYRVDRFYP